MNNFAWLESIAAKTDFDVEIENILKQQPSAIQIAFSANDNAVLRNIFGNTDKLACKNTVFQY